MRRSFRNRKISKDNQKDLEIMISAICINDEDAEIGESIIRNLEGGNTSQPRQRISINTTKLSLNAGKLSPEQFRLDVYNFSLFRTDL